MTTTTNKEEHLESFLEEDDFLARWVHWALWALAIIVCIATVTGQVESYNGLYLWFAAHHITGFWADFAPLMVDSFTIIGELAIFAGISRRWDWKSRVLPWISAFIGIGSSVAANIGDKVQFHSIPTDLTAAIPPLAGAFGIVIGLGVLKRVARDHKIRKERKAALARAEVVAGPSMEYMAHVQDVLKDKTEILPRPEPPASLDRERHGLDVLIPPQEPLVEETSTWAGIVQPITQPQKAVSAVSPLPVSREEARRRESDLRTRERPILNESGLSPYQTGAQPAIP